MKAGSLLRFVSAICLAAIALPSLAQKQNAPAKDTVVLEGVISADRTLTPDKIYVVKFNVKVGKEAVLTINPGTQLLFEDGTSIVLEGGLNVEGAPNNFVEFASLNPNKPGNGINIKGNQGKDINIRFAVFRELTMPMRFESEWSRKNVTIEKNVFTELYTGESNVLITSPVVEYKEGQDNFVTFSFSNNAFYDNWGSIFIENFEDNFMKLRFENNLITNIVVYGIDIGIPSNTPLFGLYDAMGSEYKSVIEGNSIFGNYQVNSSTDTIIREISIGIQGDGELFSIPNNFFRSRNVDYVASTFDHFYQNSNLPLLKADPLLNEPREIVPPHIWKVKLNGTEVINYDNLPDNIDIRDVTFEVHFNKAVSAFDKVQLQTIIYDTLSNMLQKNPITISQTRWSPDRKVFTFVVSNASFFRNNFAYAELINFKDADGFIVPDFPIGRRNAINHYRRTTKGGGVTTAELLSNKEGIIDVNITGDQALLPSEKTIRAIEKLPDITPLGPYRSLNKTWEVGLVGGASNYFGTLSYKLTDRDEYHFSFGIFGQYNLNKWFSFRAMFAYLPISGSDFGELDPDRFLRKHNFKNDIIEGSLTFHWHLLKYGTSRGEKFTPTFFAGVALFRNKPMKRIFLYATDDLKPVYLTYKDGVFLFDGTGDEVWVPLRPIGTEGQTVGGVDPEAFSKSPNADLYADHEAPKQYKKVQVSFPIGFSLDYIIYNKWIISAELCVRITTTRYLDDVGGYYWDRAGEDGWYENPANGSVGMHYDQATGVPTYAHQSIVDVNTDPADNTLSTIQGTAGGNTITLPQVLTFADPNNPLPPPYTITGTSYYTAALLANPSLVNLDIAIAHPNPNRPNPNSGFNDAFTFNNGKRGTFNIDHYGFVGLKISKVIGKKEKKYKAPTQKEPKFKDNDLDGLSDDDEKLKGTNVKNPDTDGDGLDDGDEVQVYASNPLNVDSDGDGLNDAREVNELTTNPIKKDSDDDGLEDGYEVNVSKSNPLDSDSDDGGMTDGDEVNRDKTNPLYAKDDKVDSDKDGVYDNADDCPTEFGLSEFKGCPDSDSDGIEDRVDDCPGIAGTVALKGCPEEEPEPEIEEEVKEVEKDLQSLLKNVEFDTNKDVIRSTSFDDLDKAAEILNEHSQYNVIIEGHTDDIGDAAVNKSLSQERADAVKRYLINQGVDGARIVAVGYGEEKPKTSNDTEQGRQVNRRVEIKLIKPY